MAYYEDLTPYSYCQRKWLPEMLNVGWLGGLARFSEGYTEPVFQEALEVLCERKPKVALCRGFHRCHFCSKSMDLNWARIGNGEIRVQGQNAVWYAAPMMIHHYVAQHQYQPPEAFIDAVLNPRAIGVPYGEYQLLPPDMIKSMVW